MPTQKLSTQLLPPSYLPCLSPAIHRDQANCNTQGGRTPLHHASTDSTPPVPGRTFRYAGNSQALREEGRFDRAPEERRMGCRLPPRWQSKDRGGVQDAVWAVNGPAGLLGSGESDPWTMNASCTVYDVCDEHGLAESKTRIRVRIRRRPTSHAGGRHQQL